MVKKPTATASTPKPEPEPAPEPAKSNLAEKVASLGINMGEVAKLLEPMIAQSVAKVLAEMKLPEIIQSTIEERVKERTDAIGTEVKAVIEKLATAQQEQGQQALAQPPGGNQLHDIATLIAAIKGGGGGDSDMSKFFVAMKSFSDASAALYQVPRYQAQKEIIDIMKAGYSIGLDTKQVIEGASKSLAETAKALAEKPTPQP